MSKEDIQQVVDSCYDQIGDCINGKAVNGKAVFMTDCVPLLADGRLTLSNLKINGVPWLPALVDAVECRELLANEGIELAPFEEKTLPIILLGEEQFGEAFFTLEPTKA